MLKTLADATKRIKKLEESSIKNMHAIANTLKEVKANGLDKNSGYADVHEYAERELGYKKSTSYALVQVAERFLTDKNESILKRKDQQDYTVTQLRELCPLPNDILMEAIEAGEISPLFSSRKLKEIVKTYKALEDKNHTPAPEAEAPAPEAEAPAPEAEAPAPEAEAPAKNDYHSQDVTINRDWITGSINQIIAAMNIINLEISKNNDALALEYVNQTKQLAELMVDKINEI